MRIAVVIPFRGNPQLLHWTLQGYALQQLSGHSLEIRVGWDGAAVSPDLPPLDSPWPITHRAFSRCGAAAVRNGLVADTDAELIIFGNADARPDPDMVRWHADTMSGLPANSLVLGAAPWETPASPTVWDAFLADTPAIFFFNQLQPQQWYDFRQAWTLNLSVRRADFLAAGGFHNEIRPVYYEDLAMAFRLLGKDRKGVFFEPRARVLHRHPTTWDQYLEREELLGIMSPVLARHCGAAFGVLHGTRDVETLSRGFREWVKMDPSLHQWIYRRMNEWQSVPLSELGANDQRHRILMNIYQMHVPLKRLAFRLGFLKGMKLGEDAHWQERQTESLWRAVAAPR